MPSVLDPTPTPAAPSTNFRAFGDVPAMRKQLFDNVHKSLSEFQPISNNRHTLELGDVQYVGPESFSRKQWKDAVMSGGSLTRKIRGTWRLKDNATGNVISERPMTLANIPYPMDDGTFIDRGNAYGIAHQLRLSSGSYARRKQNEELEAHINVLPGKGRTHRIFLEPKTGVFKVNVGQANVPLYPLLRAMGVTDQQLNQAWGTELAAGNAMKNDPQAIRKLYGHVAKQVPNADAPTMTSAVVEAFRSMQLDPTVTKHTLGGDYRDAGPETILAVTKKLLAINRKEAEPDDRDHLAYQRIIGPEDTIAERLKKARQDINKALWKASARGNLENMSPAIFDKAVRSALIGSGLGSPLEEINPLEIFDQQSRVTRMGEGGIGSMDAVPAESRSVQPSHFGFIDFLRTPESGRAGVDLRLARSAMKGSDGLLYTKVRDLKTGQEVYKSSQDLADAPLVFPGELNSNEPMVGALVRGKLSYVPREEAMYELPHMENSFSPLANLIPLKSMVKGQRAVMAARMVTQALPLVDAEAPHVQSAVPEQNDRSFEEEYARHVGAIHAASPGRVVSVAPDSVVVQYQDGTKQTHELHEHTPYNRKTFIHQTPVVRPGDVVQAGQLLARSNFTNAQGATAVGRNLRVGYLPFRGLNFEDAVVISESAKRKLSSEHAYQHDLEFDNKTKKGKRAFQAMFPGTYDRKTLENFTDDGVIKPGTVVHYGDPLILAAKERERTYGQVHRGRGPNFTDASVTWNHHAPGTVTSINVNDKGANVFVRATAEMEVGDKLSGRYGDKGVVADIIPDDEMPTDAKGNPLEVLVSPLGLISRVNSAQMIEGALGKVAALTGKPYKMRDFDTTQDALSFAEAELRKHGLTDLEDVVDQETGRKINNVFVGNRFFMKLHHTSESKGQGRSIGGYTMDGAPAKGGEAGAKRNGMLNLNAYLSHGAGKVVHDFKMVRGQANPESWAQYMAGFPMPVPKIPKAYEKFINMLRAAGINPVREGTRTQLMAMTDAKVDELAGDRELQNAETVDWKSGLRPKKGGLFDESLTGGHDGKRWAKITLSQPLPNPIMEEPIRRVLGLTKNQLRDIIAGKEKIGQMTGPAAIAAALKNINVERELNEAREIFKSAKGAKLDDAVRKIGFLKRAERLGMHPSDWMMTKVPVLPPAFRPVATMGAKKLPLVADANYLYKELFDANQLIKELDGKIDGLGEEHLTAYDALKAVTGLGAPSHPKNVERGVTGILKKIFGSSPKFGMVQRQLLGTTTDLVGRAVITPNPNFDMDTVGIPEAKAWDVYRPFVVRNLVRRGMGRLEAADIVEKQTPIAREALLTEMKARPVIIDRAPVLHRYGVMAFYPQLVKGNTMQLSPLVVGGFGADFDGDAMQYHVPTTDEAAQEAAEKMLPSKNLFSAATFKVHYVPTQDYTSGLYEASARMNKGVKPAVFARVADAIRAYAAGELKVDHPVRILEA